jgi:periplasmic protein TonB
MARNDSPFITTGERVRDFIGIAFLVSLATHFLVGSVMPNVISHTGVSPPEPVVIERIPAVVHTPPPPTPTPRPAPPPEKTPPRTKQIVAHRSPRVKLVTQASPNKAGVGVHDIIPHQNPGIPAGEPGPGATAPIVVGTPKPACSNPDVEAAVLNAVQPDYPESARDLGLGEVTAEIKVTVGSSGNLEAAAIYKSSGNSAVDQAALRAARQSSYSPKIVNCEPAAGDYLFRADFQPG